MRGWAKCLCRTGGSPSEAYGDTKALLDDKPTMRALLFVLDPLVASLGADADNVAFLLSCCNEMAAHDDAEADDMTLSVRAVAAHAGELVKRQYVKTVDNLRPFPGVVYLPTALYAPPKKGRGDAVALRRKIPVSYTHLTLPTKA